MQARYLQQLDHQSIHPRVSHPLKLRLQEGSVTITKGAKGPAIAAITPVAGRARAVNPAIAYNAMLSLDNLEFISARSSLAFFNFSVSCPSLSSAQPLKLPVNTAKLSLSCWNRSLMALESVANLSASYTGLIFSSNLNRLYHY